jgi:hypothetical protein
MTDLIYTRRPDAAPLSLADVERLAPAAFTETTSPGTSTRYRPVSTVDAIEVLADHGFRPVQAAQKKARKAAANRYAEHLIAFAQDRAEAGEVRPEIVLYNSHDGGSSLKLFGGAFRFICSNGIVAGDGYEAKARHVGSSVDGVEEMLRDVARRLPDISAQIDRMRGVTPDGWQVQRLARMAASLRWDDLTPALDADEEPRGAYYTPRTVRQMLGARRIEDIDDQSLWGAWNRVQEAALRGGVQVRSYTDRRPSGTYRRARPVGSVAESVRINRALWDAAGEILEGEAVAA